MSVKTGQAQTALSDASVGGDMQTKSSPPTTSTLLLEHG